MDRSEISARLVAHVDRNHPRLGAKVMKLRWGGLRTVQPGRRLWGAVVALGIGTGIASRAAAGRRHDGRHRLPSVPAALMGVLSVWAGIWRLDSLRWRRSHVTLLLDLPVEVLDDLIERLRADGLAVERADGPRSVGGSSSGLTCRLRDLRRVNAALDDLDRSSGQRVGSAEA